MTQDQISALSAGDEIHVFSREKDKYIKRTVNVGKNGLRYVWDDPRGYFKTRDSIPVTAALDAVTAEELPAAKKRHAERRKVEKTAEAERQKRVSEASWLVGELHAFGVSLVQYGKRELPTVDRDGLIRVDLTVKQARILRDALKGK